MKPHAFIAMPFGTKSGADGQPIDFNRIHADLFAPALKKAGCKDFRADQEKRAGSIHKDMFQELLAADLVLVDLSIDNPNVWYELGVRHALRSRGVVLVQAKGTRDKAVFDISGERKLNYTLKSGAPDPATLADEIDALAELVSETLAASTQRVLSPVYDRLPHLKEPAWRDLMMAGDNEFGAAYKAWRGCMQVAREKRRVGDVLVLADETPVQALWQEAKRDAGKYLLALQQPALALEQFDAALAIDPKDLESRCKRIICLGRLSRHEEAHVDAGALTADHPSDPEAWSLAGRVEKDRWLARWRTPGLEPAALREAAALELAALEEAITPYHQAFIANPAAYYPGINSLTLQLLLKHLGGTVDESVLAKLTGGVLWSCLSAEKLAPKDYWARATYAELCLLLNPIEAVKHEYRSAVAAANGDAFNIDSSRQTVLLLRDLQFRPEETAAALQILDAEMQRVKAPTPTRTAPRWVFVFSGYMVDTPTREKPRFPKEKVPAADAKIRAVLEKLGAGPQDLALTQGAAGGDLLFVEACQERGVPVQLLLPLPEPQFIDASVMPSADGAEWTDRYYNAKDKLTVPPRVMPVELGPTAAGASAFERCNLWLLYTALGYGPEKVRLICLWDGGGSDGPGGTQHMVDEVRRHTGRVSWIDARTL